MENCQQVQIYDDIAMVTLVPLFSFPSSGYSNYDDGTNCSRLRRFMRLLEIVRMKLEVSHAFEMKIQTFGSFSLLPVKIGRESERERDRLMLSGSYLTNHPNQLFIFQPRF